MTERPDLHEMDGEAARLYDALEQFGRELEEALYAADGELEEGAERVTPGTGNGDQPDLFEAATKAAHEAMRLMAGARRMLATQQGLRDFERAGVA